MNTSLGYISQKPKIKINYCEKKKTGGNKTICIGRVAIYTPVIINIYTCCFESVKKNKTKFNRRFQTMCVRM